MRLRPLLLLLCVGCPGFNKVALKHWYPPPDDELLQKCTGERAARCTEEALPLIDAAAPEKKPDEAARLLGAACQQGDPKACNVLDTRFTAPKRLDKMPELGGGLGRASDSYGEVACVITVAGEATSGEARRGAVPERVRGALLPALQHLSRGITPGPRRVPSAARVAAHSR